MLGLVYTTVTATGLDHDALSESDPFTFYQFMRQRLCFKGFPSSRDTEISFERINKLARHDLLKSNRFLKIRRPSFSDFYSQNTLKVIRIDFDVRARRHLLKSPSSYSGPTIRTWNLRLWAGNLDVQPWASAAQCLYRILNVPTQYPQRLVPWTRPSKPWPQPHTRDPGAHALGTARSTPRPDPMSLTLGP